MFSTPNYLTLAYEGNYWGRGDELTGRRLRVEVFTYKGKVWAAIPNIDFVSLFDSLELM